MADFRSRQIEEYIAQVLQIVPAKYMSELAQYLIVCEIELSADIRDRLIALK